MSVPRTERETSEQSSPGDDEKSLARKQANREWSCSGSRQETHMANSCRGMCTCRVCSHAHQGPHLCPYTNECRISAIG